MYKILRGGLCINVPRNIRNKNRTCIYKLGIFKSIFLGKTKLCNYHIYGIQILVKNNKRVVLSSASLIGHYPNPQISDSVKLTHLTYRIEGE